ncbi:methyltransferase family protein [Streptomyces sp. SLBN-118]|uniref:class I SAM-dependent methyltransferase n=1 Tax=Streptomyces sp. SLBN-118 TaxID=2768454 RepID=UPI001166E039|nr:class I SAM-dependent methyltransferase [Streptomyces sp. SLBN-118]TQK50413.1 methyltransferase family protein [Streptomyces sp. SLBN-118]
MTQPRNRTRARTRRVPWTALAALAGLTAGTVRARRRLAAVAVLDPAAPVDGVSLDGWQLITAKGVEVDKATLSAAVDYAERTGLKLLDLLPDSLDTERALGLLRDLELKDSRFGRTGKVRGAGHAVLVAEDVRGRSEAEVEDGLDTAELHTLLSRLKQYATAETGIAVAPGVTAPSPSGLAGRAAELRAVGVPPRLVAAAQVAGLALLVRAAVKDRRWGAAALALYWLQPALVLGGGGRGPLRPADLPRLTAARPLHSLAAALRTVASDDPGRAESLAEFAALRPGYTADLKDGSERFLEPRRPDCPWCGSAELTVRTHMPDLYQGKPGHFTLEECGACGHVFQNPRLTLDGLDFYYRDFYDGLGVGGAAHVFGTMGSSYRGRAEMLKPFGKPAAWLDVGTGHGHFCDSAREIWPDTRFDGLDMADAVREAEARGWVGTAHYGQFPELAPELVHRYDTVSMYHYLEHTRDPLAELDAAAKVLPPGGHLLIELPDPESRLSRLLGPYWVPFFQPQHQHLMPIANLRAALADRGFTVLAEEHGAAHQACDFVGAVLLTANRLAPNPYAPWGPGRTTVPRRAFRTAVQTAALPCYAVAAVLDRLRAAAARATDGGNAYRLIARKGA